MKRSLMVWGTSSGAGKSLLATALCRWAAQRGVDVAPFKAQNMSNNARVVPGRDGGYGEIGAAQYFQALAARVTPGVDMNPVLLKPESETSSQVVLQGQVVPAWSHLPWRERSEFLAVAARESYERLARRHELIIMEGAGSPAEINLAAHDYVNLGTARWARAAGDLASLLVADIDRGGAFAHLHGTWALLPDDLRGSLAGFVLNKFRGDAALLAPGPELLRSATGVPVVAVLPMRRDHGLPDEDGVFDPAESGAAAAAAPLVVAVAACPQISNLDEFQPLRQVPGLRLRWARDAAALADADWIILPGSKQVSGDLDWLRRRGMDGAIARHAAAGRPLLGICGGLQMLGLSMDDAQGVDGAAGQRAGLGLLPLHTRYEAPKRVLPLRARFGVPAPPWQALEGIEAAGYEIRNGRTFVADTPADAAAMPVLHDDAGAAIGWQRGCVLGFYAHGLFESAAVMQALFGARTRTLDRSLDGLAELVDRHFDAGVLSRLLPGVRPWRTA
ncbi:MAG: cobyric acid synthase [Burkholderiales bacterium]|nr:cobyric acid synthase [Burkholderiales bacterium]